MFNSNEQMPPGSFIASSFGKISLVYLPSYCHWSPLWIVQITIGRKGRSKYLLSCSSMEPVCANLNFGAVGSNLLKNWNDLLAQYFPFP